VRGATANSGTLGIIVGRGWRISPLAAASALSLLNSAAIAVLYGRLGGPASFGVFQFALALVDIGGVLTISGSAAAATRAAAQGRPAAWTLFRQRLPFCVAASVALVLVGAGVAATGRRETGAAIGAAALTLPLYYGADVFPAHLIGNRRYGGYLRFSAVVQSLTLAGVALALLAAPHQPWLALLALCGITGLVQASGLIPLRTVGAAFAEDVRYARHMTVVTVLSAVDARLDILVSGALLGSKAVGLAAVARMFPTLVKRLWQILYQPFFVAMSERSGAERAAMTRRYRLLLTGSLGLICLGGVAVAPFLIPALFGSRFHAAVHLAQLLLVAAALQTIAYLDEVRLKASGEVRRLSVIYLVLPVTSLVGLPLLVHFFGLDGIGYEALLASSVYVALVVPLARRIGAGG
jgi:O-antigen/teichoic acid export membrane protein